MKRTIRKEPERSPLPSSNQIISFLARTFQWKFHRGIGRRSWQKLAAGEPLSMRSQKAIMHALACALLENGKSSNAAKRSDFEKCLIRVMAQNLTDLAKAWDAECTSLRRDLPEGRESFIVSVTLRVTMVGVALWMGGFCALHRVPRLPELLSPNKAHSRQNFLGTVLSGLLRHAGVTREQLAEALDVSKQALDKWLGVNGVIPATRLDEVCAVLSEKLAGTCEPDGVRMLLRLMWAMNKVAAPVMRLLGRTETEQLIGALFRLTDVARGILEKELASLPEETRAEALRTLWRTSGPRSDLSSVVLAGMVAAEQDEAWAGVIRAVEKGRWSFLLQAAVELERQLAFGSAADQEEAPVSGDARYLRQLLLRSADTLPQYFAYHLTPSRYVLELVQVRLYLQEARRLCGDKGRADVRPQLLALAETSRASAPHVTRSLRLQFEMVAWTCYQGCFIRQVWEYQDALQRGDEHAVEESCRALLLLNGQMSSPWLEQWVAEGQSVAMNSPM